MSVIQRALLQVMKTLAGEGMTLVMVTHEIGFAAQMADQVAFMVAGRMVAAGSPSEIFRTPDDPRLKQVLHSYHERNDIRDAAFGRQTMTRRGFDARRPS